MQNQVKRLSSLAPTEREARSSIGELGGVKYGIHGTHDPRTKKLGHRRVNEDGMVTYKKKPTTELMSAIQLGIGQSITSLAGRAKRDLLLQDFSIVETVIFPKEGSVMTPSHDYSDFRFKTYAPVAFRYFRELFGIQPDDFLLSLSNYPLKELSNPGASGSIFYITDDDEFIIKTVSNKEADFLQKLLPGYYMNLNQNPRTLLPKFYGLFCYQCGGKNIRFVIMNNLLPMSIIMHEKYDLKGSTCKRKASKAEREKSRPTLKDLDFLELHAEGIMLEAETFAALNKTVERDCRVLQSFQIMDYSMLMTIHNIDQEVRDRNAVEEEATASRVVPEAIASDALKSTVTRVRSIHQRLAQFSTTMEAIHAKSEPLEVNDDEIPIGGIPARNYRGDRLLLYIGIIDILQSYRFAKKLEHAVKSIVHDGDTISVHRPGFYAQRFQNFFSETVFKKIPSLDQPQVKGPHVRFKKLVQIALKQSPAQRKSLTGKALAAEEKDHERPDILPNTASTRVPFSMQSSYNNKTTEGLKMNEVENSPTPTLPSTSVSTPSHTFTEGTPSYTTSSPSISTSNTPLHTATQPLSNDTLKSIITQSSITTVTTKTIYLSELSAETKCTDDSPKRVGTSVDT